MYSVTFFLLPYCNTIVYYVIRHFRVMVTSVHNNHHRHPRINACIAIKDRFDLIY